MKEERKKCRERDEREREKRGEEEEAGAASEKDDRVGVEWMTDSKIESVDLIM